MKLCKMTLIIVGLIVVVMGIAGLPGISEWGTEPLWHAVLKIIVGIAAILIALMEKAK